MLVTVSNNCLFIDMREYTMCDRFLFNDIRGHLALNVQKLGDNCIQNFQLGKYILGYTVRNFVLILVLKHDFLPHI